MKILVADDEAGMRHLFKKIFITEFPGCVVDLVAGGEEAVAAARTGNYDVIWLDVRMPVKGGYEACLEIEQMCSKEKLKMPFVIFCTGFKVPEEIEKLTADPTRYALLRKPASYAQIVDTFKTVK